MAKVTSGVPDQDVAGHRHLAAAAPDAPLDQRDDRRRKLLQGAHQHPQRVAPAERIAAAVGQLANVVAGTPDFAARRCTQHDGP